MDTVLQHIQPSLDQLGAQYDGRNNCIARLRPIPNWPDDIRCVPVVVTRSALFGLHQKNISRLDFIRTKIVSQSGVTINYTGPQLDQKSLHVWLEVLHCCRGQVPGSECMISAYQLLKRMEQADSGQHRRILAVCLERLAAAHVEVNLDIGISGITHAGPLVFISEKRNGYVFSIGSNILNIFDNYSMLNRRVVCELRGYQLAKWLYCFYSTHQRPYSIKVETIRRVCGSSTARLADFRRLLIASLALLEKTTLLYGNEIYKGQVTSKDHLIIIRLKKN